MTRNKRVAIVHKIKEKFNVDVDPKDLIELEKDKTYFIKVGGFQIEAFYFSTRAIRVLIVC